MGNITNDIPILDNVSVEMKKPQEILAETIFSRGYGELVTHEEIERIIGVSRNDDRTDYYRIVNATKKILLRDYRRQIESVNKIGYRFIKPGDHVSNAINYYGRGFRAIRKGKYILDMAPVNDMTEEERVTYTRVHDRSILLHASMEGALCELKTLGVKTHPLLSLNKD